MRLIDNIHFDGNSFASWNNNRQFELTFIVESSSDSQNLFVYNIIFLHCYKCANKLASWPVLVFSKIVGIVVSTC